MATTGVAPNSSTATSRTREVKSSDEKGKMFCNIFGRKCHCTLQTLH
jgi:hypothetical protein